MIIDAEFSQCHRKTLTLTKIERIPLSITNENKQAPQAILSRGEAFELLAKFNE